MHYDSFHSHVQSFRLISYDASAPQVGPLTGYEPQDLIERTLYQYVHADDMNGIRASHITCESKLCRSDYARIFWHLLGWRHVSLSNELMNCWPFANLFLCLISCSAEQGPVEHQVLPLPDEGGRLGVGAELPNHRPQLAVLQAPLHRQRQLRHQVTRVVKMFHQCKIHEVHVVLSDPIASDSSRTSS